MTVYRKNISINVGETFSENLTLLSADGSGVVDLTGFTAQSQLRNCLLYTSPSPRDPIGSRMPSSA